MSTLAEVITPEEMLTPSLLALFNPSSLSDLKNIALQVLNML